MNPNLDLVTVIEHEIFAYFGEDHDLSKAIYDSIRNWMDRNQIIFYQP